MPRHLFHGLIVFIVLATFSPAQTTKAPADVQAPASKAPVIRVNVNVVQVDAVVTDKKGTHVPDLKAEDFTILENGRPQKITNFSYITVRPAPSASVPVVANGSPVPMAPLKPEQVRRTIVFVVDDLGLNYEHMVYVQSALKKFVNEQMQPGDLVALLLTGRGMGALQQFTSDKKVILAAISRLKWNPYGYANQIGMSEDDAATMEELSTLAALDSLNYIVTGLGETFREIPGRKSVIFFSDGYKVSEKSVAAAAPGRTTDQGGSTSRTRSSPSPLAMTMPITAQEDPFDGRIRNERLNDAFQRVINSANRASVVLYTVEARTAEPLGVDAKNPLKEDSSQVSTPFQRRMELIERQQTLTHIAEETGGQFSGNSNDINVGIQRALDDQNGYYLIGYSPDEPPTGKSGQKYPYHRISVKVNRPGLHVRSRTGFYGQTGEDESSTPRTPIDQLLAAIRSPFNAAGIPVRITALYGHDAKNGPSLRTMVYIDPSQLTFTPQPDGRHQVALNLLALTFSEGGSVGTPFANNYDIKLGEKEYQRCLREGLVYNLMIEAKKPGPYQLRIAVRDDASGRLGSAYQFVDVPDLANKRLALSGIVLTGGQPASSSTPTNFSPTESILGRGAEKGTSTPQEAEIQSGPALRELRPGMVLHFMAQAYNVRLDSKTSRPQLMMRMQLLRDGKILFTRESPYTSSSPSDSSSPLLVGQMGLGATPPPGKYILQLTVTDLLAKEKSRTATQWIDFDVIR